MPSVVIPPNRAANLTGIDNVDIVRRGRLTYGQNPRPIVPAAKRKPSIRVVNVCRNTDPVQR